MSSVSHNIPVGSPQNPSNLLTPSSSGKGSGRKISQIISSIKHTFCKRTECRSKVRELGKVYELSKYGQRVFDASIKNICMNMDVSPSKLVKGHEDFLTQNYIHILSLTENEDEVRQAIEFVKENKDALLGYKEINEIVLMQNFIRRIKKIEDCDQIDMEVVRRTRGVGMLRFHATNSSVLPSIQEHGLSCHHRTYDRELFLKILAISEKAELHLFPFAANDVRKQYVCTSTDLPDCLTVYGTEKYSEWIRACISLLGKTPDDILTNPQGILEALDNLMKEKANVLTQAEIDLFKGFIASTLESFKKAPPYRVFIVGRKDKDRETDALADYTNLMKKLSGKDEFYRKIFTEEIQNAVYSRGRSFYLVVVEKWSPEKVSTSDCSFLKRENLDFFKL